MWWDIDPAPQSLPGFLRGFLAGVAFALVAVAVALLMWSVS